MKPVETSSRERGAALLIVLLQVAALSVIALAIVQHVTQSLRMSAISSARGQALWYAFGAEDLAVAKLSEVMKLTDGEINFSTPGLGVPLVFPLGDGRLNARFDDQTNCFNLNSLSQASEEGEEAQETTAVDAAVFYQQLLIALDFDLNKAQEMVSSLQDWIDEDRLPRASGAETTYYASLPQPYGAADTLLVTPQELLAIKGYDRESYRRLRPFVCVRPDATLGPFNVNTLKPDMAPLLVPVFSGEIEVEAVRQELESISGEVFSSETDFLARPAFALIASEKRLASLLGIQSTHFRLTGEVVYLDTVTSYEAVLARDDANEVELLRRRFGVDE